MEKQELANLLQNSNKDPSLLIFEDELTSIYNRRFLFTYLKSLQWDSLNDNPIALIMMDIDHFKQINDTYGHQAGDQALVWLSNHLKKIASEHDYPIRYAGDEFMILLRQNTKDGAVETGKRLIQLVHESPFITDNHKNLKVTVSLGVASAPQDALEGKSLIHEADTALYYAKKKGRDCLAISGEVIEDQVFAKRALEKLRSTKIVGRKNQLSVIEEAINKFVQKERQWIIIEGSQGLGKTEFLNATRDAFSDAIAQNEQKRVWQVTIRGSQNEGFRPYYLMTDILIRILGQHQDNGAAVLQNLDTEKAAYIGHVLPHLKIDQQSIKAKTEAELRKGIFTALLHFLAKIIEDSPLILIIDDLQFVDEASLVLLKHLFKQYEIPIFICCASNIIREPQCDAPIAPMTEFCQRYGEEIGIQKLALTKLTAADISEHLRNLFPNIQPPCNLEQELEKTTSGNPLFLKEIIRKFIRDEKIALVGQQWVMHPLEQGYLPRSLDAIVENKIASFDEDSRQALQQISAFNGDVALSMLKGSSRQMEGRLLDVIDRAIGEGLLDSDFQLNDEMIGFLGKRLQEIVYKSISPSKKEDIHNQIGKYQEDLYNKHLLFSAAPLIYHFNRSNDLETTNKYMHIQSVLDNRNFNSKESLSYSSNPEEETDVPLSPEDLKKVPAIVRDFAAAVRSCRLYPSGNKLVSNAIGLLNEGINQVLCNNEKLNISRIKNSLVINGQKIDTSDSKMVTEAFFNLLTRFDLEGISFFPGIVEQELTSLIEELGRSAQKTFDKNFWAEFAT
ncbi:MAG: diguanylate cyclase, partial [Pseudomonadota bacterium]